MRFKPYIIAIILFITIIPARALAIHKCELEYIDLDKGYISGNKGNWAPCVVVTDSSMWIKQGWKEYYDECTLDFIIDANRQDEGTCKVGMKNTLLFQPRNAPSHNIRSSEITSGVAYLDQAVDILRETSILGWKVLWDNDDDDPCLGDPNEDGSCAKDAIFFDIPTSFNFLYMLDERGRGNNDWNNHQTTIIAPFSGSCFDIDPENSAAIANHCDEEPYKSRLHIHNPGCGEDNTNCMRPTFNIYNDAQLDLRDMEITMTSEWGSLAYTYSTARLILMRNQITVSNSISLFHGRSTQFFGHLPNIDMKSEALTRAYPNRIKGTIRKNVFWFTDAAPVDFNPVDYFGPEHLNLRFDNSFGETASPYRFSDTPHTAIRCEQYAHGQCTIDGSKLLKERAYRTEAIVYAIADPGSAEEPITLPLYRVNSDGAIVGIEGTLKDGHVTIPLDPLSEILFTESGRRISMPLEPPITENGHCRILDRDEEELLATCDTPVVEIIGKGGITLWTQLAYGKEEVTTIERAGDLYRLTLHEVTTNTGKTAAERIRDGGSSVTLKTWGKQEIEIERDHSDPIYCSFHAATCAPTDTTCRITCTHTPQADPFLRTRIGLIDAEMQSAQPFAIGNGGFALIGDRTQMQLDRRYYTTMGEAIAFRQCPSHMIIDEDGVCQMVRGFTDEPNGTTHAICPAPTILSADTTQCICPDPSQDMIWEEGKPLCLRPCDVDETREGHYCRAIPDPGDDDDDDDDDDNTIKEIGDDDDDLIGDDDDDTGCSAMDRMMGRCDDDVEVDEIGLSSSDDALPTGTTGGGCSLTPAHATAWPAILFGISLLPIALVRTKRRR